MTVVALVAGCAPDDVGGTENSAAAKTYRSTCATCHGAEGEGTVGLPIGKGVTVDKYSQAEMEALVANGIRGMPPMKGQLSEAEIAAVVTYVRDELGRGPTTTTAATAPKGTGTRSGLRGTPPEVADHTADWPLPNRDYASTRAVPESPITSRTIDRLEVAWTYDVPGAGSFGNLTTTPLIVGDTVYVGDLQTRVHAVDRATGEERFTVGKASGIFGPTGVATGWGLVYGTKGNTAGRGTMIAAYDAETGKEAWATDISANGGEVNMQPSVYDGLVFAATSGYGAGTRGTIYALDAKTGEIIWSFDVIDSDDLWGHPDINSGGGIWYPPTIDTERGVAYFGTGNPYPFPGTKGFPNGSSRPGDNKWTDSTLALDIATGKLVWGRQAIAHDIFDRDAMQTARVDATVDGKDRELVISTGKLGVVTAIDAGTGKAVWSTEVGTHENDDLTGIDGPTTVYPGSLGGVETPVAVADGTVYAAVMNAPTTYEGPEETSYGLGVQIGTKPGRLVAVEAGTGKLQWDVEVPGDALGGATVVGDLVLTATFAGTILAYDRATGAEVWRYKAAGGINGWPAVAGDTIVYPVGLSKTPQLVAFRLADG